MTNVKRPIHLQLRPAAAVPGSLACQRRSAHPAGTPLHTPTSFSPSPPTSGAKQALSPTVAESLPSQILPHLFVGAQEQTNRETVNRLNIKYILSLGLLPLVLQQPPTPTSPSSRQQQQASLMPSQNCSKDYKIRIRSNTPTSTTPTPTGQSSSGLHSPLPAAANVGQCSGESAATFKRTISPAPQRDDENKDVKQVRSVYCKCINVSDNSDQMLMKFFDEAYVFIEEARRKKCNILVHCLAGISRSPTVAIAYLMRVKAMHWKDAYDLVKQCRPQIDPNLSFMGQLRIYNKSLHDGKVVDLSNSLSASNNLVSKQQEKATTMMMIEQLPQQNKSPTATTIRSTAHHLHNHHQMNNLNRLDTRTTDN